jgi:trehalose-6-phosphate synthase
MTNINLVSYELTALQQNKNKNLFLSQFPEDAHSLNVAIVINPCDKVEHASPFCRAINISESEWIVINKQMLHYVMTHTEAYW